LIFNPNYKSFTSNVTIDDVLAKLHKGDAPKGENRKGHPALSWLDVKNPSAADKALIQKLNKRPEYEFYNLTKDPHELKNEIDNPEYKAVVEKMKKALFARLDQLGDSDPLATEKKMVKGGSKKKKKK
jgi:hypothetical protein